MVPQSLLTKLRNYHPSEEGLRIVGAVPTILLVGISGAGKDTLNRELLKIGHYHRIVTHTTRRPRYNHGVLETDGLEYHFIDFQTAEHIVDARGFLEAKVYSNNVYGSSVAEFQMAGDEGKIALADIDVQGVAEYMRMIPRQVRPVFILPPTYEVWQQRLMTRYGDSHEDHTDDLRLRNQAAARELEELLAKDYYFALINDDLKTTVAAADTIATTGAQPAEQKEAGRQVAQAILDQIHSRL